MYKNYEVILIDFKRGVSFSEFGNNITVYYDYKEVIEIFKELLNETTNRLDKFRGAGVDNISDYNKQAGNYLSRKIVFIDELAELLKTKNKEISNILYESIETLTRISRAVGIHLIMGIQRVDSTIVSGQIKNNVSFRVCGRFVDKEPSIIMLGKYIANKLPNVKGRFIVKDESFYEVQSFYFEQSKRAEKPIEEYTNLVSDEMVEAILKGTYTGNSSPVIVQEKTEISSRIIEEEKQGDSFEFDFSEFGKK